MKWNCKGSAVIAICALIIAAGVVVGHGNWYDEVNRSEPPYAWMQELASVKLTWGIPFGEYAKLEPLSRLQFVRDIISAVDTLRLVLERLKERAPSLSNPSLEDICEALNLPSLTVGDVERVAVLLRSLISYFADDINSLSLEENADCLLRIVNSFESMMRSFPSKSESGARRQSATGITLLKSQRGSTISLSTPQGGAKVGNALSQLNRLGLGLDDSAHDVVIAYWLGEGKVLLSDTATTVTLPFMSLRISSQRVYSVSPRDAERIINAQVAIPFGERWRLLGRYAQRLPIWSRNASLSDLLRYGNVEIGGQYKDSKLSAYALYTRFGDSGSIFSDGGSSWRAYDALHGVAFGFSWHPSERLFARYRLQLLSSIDENERAYRVHVGQVDYLWSDRWAFTFGLRRTIAPFNADAISTGAILGISYMVSPQVELRLLYQITDYESRQRQSHEETAKLHLQLRF